MEIREAKRFGIATEIKNIDFAGIMDRMRKKVAAGNNRIKEALEKAEEFDFYFGEAEFTGDYTLTVKGETIKGKSFFLVTGARPLVPAVKGIESVEYFTNDSVLQLRERPESMVIIGGGYIAAEFAHFFEAMGTEVTIVQRNKRLVPEEEPEISELLKKALSRRMKVLTDTEAVEVRQHGKMVTVTVKERGTGKQTEITAQALLVAAGRKSNADALMVEKTGVKTNEQGYISVDEYFETTKKDIWAFGDAIGRKMFKHVANREASLVWHNAAHKEKEKMDYLAAPHAVFTHPEIASVGLTEEEAGKAYPVRELLVGKAKYSQTARGEAMMEEEAFAKAIVKKKDGKILGFHIIGPYASILIQEVVNVMANNGDMWSIARAMHVQPALSEVIVTTLGNLEEPE